MGTERGFTARRPIAPCCRMASEANAAVGARSPKNRRLFAPPHLIRSGGIGYAGLALLSLLLSGAVTFCLAKGLYRLLKGREWAVALTLVLLGAALQLTSLLTAIGRTPAYVDVPIAPRVGALIKDTLLSAAAYALLFLCIQQWWERGARAATGELEEKKEEAEEELFEEEQKEERENP